MEFFWCLSVSRSLLSRLSLAINVLTTLSAIDEVINIQKHIQMFCGSCLKHQDETPDCHVGLHLNAVYNIRVTQ